MKEMRRVIALLLCLVMLVGNVPVQALAAEGETSTEPSVVETTAETAAETTEETEPAKPDKAAGKKTEKPGKEGKPGKPGKNETVPETTKETEPEATKETEPEATKETEPEATKETEPEATKETEPEATKETEPEATKETEPEATKGEGKSDDKSSEDASKSRTIPEEETEQEEEPADEEEIYEVEALYAGIITGAEPVPAALISERIVPSKAEVKAALEEARTYIDSITVNKSSNDPATVVGNYGTHFTWDNEKRESSKPYLYDWSYYNGVVFEGLEYLYEVTGNSQYRNYVVEYMSSLIASDGSWAKCTNNSSKTAAGYVDYHGADCYKTASLLLDAYAMTGDSRYLTRAEALYADLDAAAEKYLLPDAGNNYHHTWASASSPNLWLDGLYMILPFRAEYAARIGDTAELQAIVDRLTWVSNNMYSSSSGLFYHAANSASSNSGTYWLRSMGWYAAAIADVMDSVDASQRATLAAQLTKLVDGLEPYRNEYGMWLNNLAASESGTNPYETSGTALVCYAVMKAVNNGWIDDSYAERALTALVGICDNKLENNSLTDICFKGVPSGSNSTFYDNEGKGLGPFIMLTAEVQEYYDEVLGLPVITGISVSEGDSYYTGNALAPVVTASYDVGEPKTITDYTVEGEYDMNAAGTYTVTIKVGEFAAEYTFTVQEPAVPENGTLTGLKVTAYPALKHFVTEEALDITGMVVAATFQVEDKSFDVQIPWERTSADGQGYSVTYEPDLSSVGEKTVTIRYTHGDVTLTDTFIVTVYGKTFTAAVAPDGEAADVTVEVSLPGVSSVAVEESGDTVKAAAAELAGEGDYVAYDITLTEDYAEGQEGLSFKVTMPLPQGEGVAQVWYIPTAEGEEPEQMTDAVDNGNGTVTFTTTHFSDYVAFYSEESSEGTGELPGTKTYTLDTNGVTANKNYLIVNGSGIRYALTNNNGTAGRTQVTVSGNTITVEDDANIAWVFSGSNSGTVGNNGRYVYPNDGSLNLNTDDTNMTISSQGNGAYRIYRSQTNNYYYLSYSRNAWTGARTRQENGIGTVYLYELTGEVSGGSVRFSMPKTATLQAGFAADPVGEGKVSVTLDGSEVALEACEITWETSDNDIATVTEEGVITGLKAGTATITATLTAVNGTALKNAIKLTTTVTVNEKTIVGEPELSGLTGEVVRGCSEAAATGAKITVQYDDGTDGEIDVTVGMLSPSAAFDTTEEGIYNGLTVTYNGRVLTNAFTLTVNPVPGNNYPEYPNEGSVNVDKNADATNLLEAGVVQIELTTSGIPVKTGVDAVLVIDVSNSMAWETGGKDDNFTANKLTEVMSAVDDFAEILLAPNEDGTPTNNTITIVTFAGYDADHSPNTGYIDSVRTLISGSSSIDDISYVTANTKFTGRDSNNDYLLQVGQVLNGVRSVVGPSKNRGDTNYDYAFWQASEAIEDGNLGGDNREIHVLFMTDGCASNFNDYYYRSNNVGWYYRPGTTTAYTYYAASNGTAWTNYILNTLIPDNLGNKYAKELAQKVNSIYAVGFDMANGSFTGLSTWDSSVNWTNVFNDIVSRLVTDAEGNGMIPVTNATDTATLNTFYTSLAQELRYAATNAYFVDQMGDSFNLQLASHILRRNNDGELNFEDLSNLEMANGEGTISITPQIQILNYKIYTKADAEADLCSEADIGKRYGDPIVMETVTFTDNAAELAADDIDDALQTITITAATSTAKGDEPCLGVDGIIYGKYFYYNTNATATNITLADGSTYSLPAETFYWNIGTINNVEWAMTYYVYLAGSMEGYASAGGYATNNYATLYYDNWLGNNAFKPTTSPVVGWESANVKYAFYLVDESGNPVVNQTTGETGNFQNAVKITQPVLWEEILLNNLDSINTIEAKSADILPYGYDLFDESAAYTVVILSTSGQGAWTITYDPALNGGENTTYVTGHNGTNYTNETKVTGWEGEPDATYTYRPGYGYTGTTVWFAVVWVPKTVPDAVVIDYGLPVDVSVLANDQFGENGSVIGIGTIDEMNSVLAGATETTYAKYTAADSELFTDETLPLNYGNAKMNGQKVRYTPTTMEWSKAGANSYDKFAYEVRYDCKDYDGDTVTDLPDQYYYGEVTVIPATTVYYEDTYVNGSGETNSSLTFSTVDSKTWEPVDNRWEIVGATVNTTQAEDRPGQYSLPDIDANNVYGYDGAYAGNNMAMYSLGSAHKITVDDTINGVVEFSFYGTGFDLISLTDNTSGTIFADVVGNGVEARYVVDNYFGYVYNNVEGEDRWIIAESADPNAIYQVPVMKVEGLPYGRYDVKLTAAYDWIFDHTDAGAYDLYVDAIRIYDPAGESADALSDVVFEGETDDKDVTIADIYEMDSEGWPQYVEVRNQLISEDTYKNAAGGDTFQGAIFIDGIENNYSVSNYTNFGPNNEVYLAPGQAVAFELDLSEYIEPDEHGVDKNIVADVQLGVKSAIGEPVTVKLTTDTSTSGTGSVTANATRSFNTSTDMYYSFREMVDLGAKLDTDANDGSYEESNDSRTIVTIKNDGSAGIVSITNVKVTFSRQPAEVEPIITWSLPGAARALMMMRAAPSVEIDPAETEATEPDTSAPETTVPEEETEPGTSDPEETEPVTSAPEEETEPEETVPDKDAEKLQKALEKAAKEAAKIAKELQKAAENAAKQAAKALSKLFSGWF